MLDDIKKLEELIGSDVDSSWNEHVFSSLDREIISRSTDIGNLLNEAIRKNCNDLLRLVLDMGVDVNMEVTDGGFSPILVAAEVGNIEAIDCLLSKGADMDVEDNIGSTPVSLAAEEEKWETVRFLVKRGARLDLERENFYVVEDDVDAGQTALHWAAYYGNIEMIDFLIKHGADKDKENAIEATPLFEAVRNDRTDAAIFLINQGVNLELGDGESPITSAIKRKNKRLIDALLKAGVDVNFGVEDYDYDDPLETALEMEDYDIVYKLLKAGANADYHYLNLIEIIERANNDVNDLRRIYTNNVYENTKSKIVAVEKYISDLYKVQKILYHACRELEGNIQEAKNQEMFLGTETIFEDDEKKRNRAEAREKVNELEGTFKKCKGYYDEAVSERNRVITEDMLEFRKVKRKKITQEDLNPRKRSKLM